MKAAYLHGFRSFPKRESRKVQVLVERAGDDKVVVPDYFPHSPELAMARLRELRENAGDEPLLVMGCSLGGFWASWMAAEFGVTAIALNPQFHPHASLETGEFSTFDDKSITVTESDLKVFEAQQERLKDSTQLPLTVLVNRDDELIPCQETLDFLAEHPLTHDIEVFETGGHRFENIDDVAVLDAINRVTARLP